MTGTSGSRCCARPVRWCRRADDWADLERGAGLVPARSTAAPIRRWRARWPRPGCGRHDPDGALPHLDCAQAGCPPRRSGRGLGRLWLAALQVMRTTGEADLTRHWAMASRAHEESSSVPEHRATGLLWLALGCARLRQQQPQQAAVALQHSTSQLAAGGLGLVRERARVLGGDGARVLRRPGDRHPGRGRGGRRASQRAGARADPRGQPGGHPHRQGRARGRRHPAGPGRPGRPAGDGSAAGGRARDRRACPRWPEPGSRSTRATWRARAAWSGC